MGMVWCKDWKGKLDMGLYFLLLLFLIFTTVGWGHSPQTTLTHKHILKSSDCPETCHIWNALHIWNFYKMWHVLSVMFWRASDKKYYKFEVSFCSVFKLRLGNNKDISQSIKDFFQRQNILSKPMKELRVTTIPLTQQMKPRNPACALYERFDSISAVRHIERPRVLNKRLRKLKSLIDRRCYYINEMAMDLGTCRNILHSIVAIFKVSNIERFEVEKFSLVKFKTSLSNWIC